MVNAYSRKIIVDFAKRDYLDNRKRNLLTVIAIVLTTFMLTSIFSIGLSYWKTVTKRSVMMEGMEFDVQIPTPTKEQVEKANGMKQILYAGVTVECAAIDAYDGNTTNISLFWSDKVNWEKQCIPAFSFVEGSYPKQENEIVMSVWTLKKIGIEKPKIGMQLPMSYHGLIKNMETEKKPFILSGFYKDDTGIAKGFVSKSFYERMGAVQTNSLQSRLKLTFKNPVYGQKEIEELERELEVREDQRIFGDRDMKSNLFKFMGELACLLVLIILSGYLFIYNILYISISQKIRFFGQLKLIGATSRQIQSFIRMQMIWNLSIGIPLGLIFGAVASFLIVPSVMNFSNPIGDKTQTVMFHPAIFIGTALFSVITVLVSSRKSADIAGNISPVEASRYIAIAPKIKRRKRVNGSKISHMAWRNLFREKKQAVIIFLSFFVALTALLSIMILIKGNNTKQVLNTLFDYDLRIVNITMGNNSPIEKIKDSDIEQIESLEGVEVVRKVFSSEIIMPYDKEVLETYYEGVYDSFYVARESYEKDMEKYKNNPEDRWFRGRFVGIDEEGFEVLNERLGGTVNKKAFMSGEIGILDSLWDISAKEIIGKQLRYRLPSDSDLEQRSIEIAAENRSWSGKSVTQFSGGIAPNVIISEAFMKKLLKKPLIELIDIQYKEAFHPKLDAKIRTLFSDDKALIFDSKMDQYGKLKLEENQMKVMGGSFGMILAMLAILNFGNMIAAGIQNRRKEFAALESIGMTSRQIKQVLVLEGLGYGCITILMVLIGGIPISYLLFRSLNIYGTGFAIPVLPVMIVFGLILFICISIPPIAYQIMQKDSIVEQLKDME